MDTYRHTDMACAEFRSLIPLVYDDCGASTRIDHIVIQCWASYYHQQPRYCLSTLCCVSLNNFVISQPILINLTFLNSLENSASTSIKHSHLLYIYPMRTESNKSCYFSAKNMSHRSYNQMPSQLVSHRTQILPLLLHEEKKSDL